MNVDRQILATQSLYHLCAGLDMTRQESWDAIVAVANLLAERMPDMVMDVLLEIEKEYGGMKK
jgi:hypothetical protein